MTFEPSKFSNTTFGAPARRQLTTMQQNPMNFSTTSNPSNLAPTADQQLAAQFQQRQLMQQANQQQQQASSTTSSAMPQSTGVKPFSSLPSVVMNNRHVFAPMSNVSQHQQHVNASVNQSTDDGQTQFNSFAQFQRTIAQQQQAPPQQPSLIHDQHDAQLAPEAPVESFTVRTLSKKTPMLDSSDGDDDDHDNSDASHGGLSVSDRNAIAAAIEAENAVAAQQQQVSSHAPVKEAISQAAFKKRHAAKFADENDNNNAVGANNQQQQQHSVKRSRTTSPASVHSYDELRRDEQALWSLLSATYAQCRAIEQQLSECHARLQRHAASKTRHY